jgi:hypothetical protein
MGEFNMRLLPLLVFGTFCQLASFFSPFEEQRPLDQASCNVIESTLPSDPPLKDTEEVTSEEEVEGRLNVLLKFVVHYTNLERFHDAEDFSHLHINVTDRFTRYRSLRI